MTREEAILHMTLRREELKHSVGDLDEDIKAFDMAIEALEHEPKFIAKADGTIEQIKDCEDCLFKKEWEKIGKLISAVLEKQTEQEINSDCISREKTLEKFCDYVGAGMSMNDFDALYDIVSKMPSVQQKTEQEPCEDCVSRQALIKVLNTMDRYVSEELTLCDTNKKFPANEVFVVDDVYEEIVEQLPSVKKKPKTDVLDKIKAELLANAEMHEDGDYYLRDKWVSEIIDKYRQEG